MNTLRRLLLLAILNVTALLVGCAAGVTKQATDPVRIAPSASAANRIVLYVTAKPALATGEDWPAFREEWQTSMTTATTAAGLSFKFAAPDEPMPTDPATVITLSVNDYRYVSQAKRYVVGVFSGNAFMDVDAQFTETPSGRLLGARKYATSSSAWQGVFSAMTPKQVEAVSQELVKEVKSK